MKSELSWDIMKRFSGSDRECFSYRDVALEYPDTNRAQLSKILSGMVERGMLIKLNRNLYHIVPTSADKAINKEYQGYQFSIRLSY